MFKASNLKQVYLNYVYLIDDGPQTLQRSTEYGILNFQ